MGRLFKVVDGKKVWLSKEEADEFRNTAPRTYPRAERVAERNALLAASDWVVIRSMETGEPIPQEWIDYRQALRDMPENPENWPEIPEK